MDRQPVTWLRVQLEHAQPRFLTLGLAAITEH